MMAATKIWAEMTRKVGVSPSSAPLRKSLERVFDGNSQLGASSIGFQVGGSRSPPLDPRRESDIVRFNFFFEPILTFVAAASRLQRPGRKTFACYFRPGLNNIPTFLNPRPPRTSLYSNQTSTSVPLLMPQHKCTGSAPN